MAITRFLCQRRAVGVGYLVGLVATAALLAAYGWPWWAWLPAALLAGPLAAAVPILFGYGYYKYLARGLLEAQRPAPVTTRTLADAPCDRPERPQ